MFPLNNCSVISTAGDDFVAVVGVHGTHSSDFIRMSGHSHARGDGIRRVEFAHWIVEEAYGTEIVANNKMAIVVFLSDDVHGVDVIELDPALDVEVLFVPANL